MEEIRNSIWDAIHSHQQEKRESLLNKNRNIDPVNNLSHVGKEEVTKIANELKKKSATPEKLLKLKEFFLLDKENASTFLKVDGALQALVRALSGQNAKYQISAAYCLCNLSLGDKYIKIIQVAGPYLLIHLEGMNSYLIEVCIWTLGNLSSHNSECVKLLTQQGALKLLANHLNSKDENINIAAAYSLSHFLYAGFDVLNPSDLEPVIEPTISLFKVKHTSVAYIMSLLSSSTSCQLKLLKASVHIDSLVFLSSSLKENILHCSWYIRIIANLITEGSGQAALTLLNHVVVEPGTGNATTLLKSIEYLFGSGQIFLIKECSWLLGNLLNHKNPQVASLTMESDIIQKITVPVRYYLMGQKSNAP